MLIFFSQLILFALLLPLQLHAQESGSNGSSGSSGGSQFAQKYQARKAERFDIISWLTDQKKIRSAQDSKYGSGGGSGWHIHPDTVLTFMHEKAALTRDGATLGSAETSFARAQFLMDDFIAQGSTKRLINIDVGVEAYYGQTQHFAVDATSTQAQWQSTEKGAALLLRPFGRSSQDTGLMLKVGYMTLNETGLWSLTSTQANNLGSLYFGGEAKLYLLPFLGGIAEYQATPSSNDSGVNGSWSLTRWRYGAFIEYKLLAIGAVMTTSTYTLAPSGGTAQINDYDKGYSLVCFFIFLSLGSG